MTRRRFQHCKNEKCNRRLEELLDRPGEPPPAPRLCEACLAAQAEIAGAGLLTFAAGLREGYLRSALAAGVVAILVGLAVVGWYLTRG